MKSLFMAYFVASSIAYSASPMDKWLSNTNSIDRSEVGQVEQEILADYKATLESDLERFSSHRLGEVKLQDITMRFSGTTIGEKPETGYPLYITLHGGGSAPSSLNDRQWEHMKYYYRDSVKSGIYVAVRGITDTWNLHFRDESYPLYDKLIENMIAYENVDPNRVYILGFSAGGDGVYQISARMPDRWAACNMSAGHHNGVSATNLHNTPLLLQMGENDSSYNRNKEVVNYYELLRSLAGDFGGYETDIFLHYKGSHNSWSDNNPLNPEMKVIEWPLSWRDYGDDSSVLKRTNAIHWVNQFQRNPLPRRIIWDTNVKANLRENHTQSYVTAQEIGSSQNQMYWLEADSEKCKAIIIADFYQDSKTYDIQASTELCSSISILVSRELVKDAQSVDVVVNGELKKTHLFQIKPRVMAQTLLSRGDPSYIFHDRIEVKL